MAWYLNAKSTIFAEHSIMLASIGRLINWFD